jgi:hypothetical protein
LFQREDTFDHLTFQCRNFLSIKEDPDDINEEDDSKSNNFDSDVNTEIERILAEGYGKKAKSKDKFKRGCPGPGPSPGT